MSSLALDVPLYIKFKDKHIYSNLCPISTTNLSTQCILIVAWAPKTIVFGLKELIKTLYQDSVMKGFILGETQTNLLIIQSLITIKQALTACAVKCFMVDINWCKSHLYFLSTFPFKTPEYFKIYLIFI